MKNKLNMSHVAYAGYDKAAAGLLDLVRKNRVHIDNVEIKFSELQDVYLERNSDLYSGTEETELIRYYFKTMLYKYYLASISLEQLQAVRHNHIDQELLHALENSLDRLDCSDDEELLVSFGLECFLHHVRAFLNFYMLYVCLLLKTGHKGSMKLEVFYKELAKAKDSRFADKADYVEEYFRSKVFGEDASEHVQFTNWGALVRDLRNKIAHRDRLRPSFESAETLARGVLLGWPTLRGMTYHSFCSYVDNGMYSLFTDLLTHLYDTGVQVGKRCEK